MITELSEAAIWAQLNTVKDPEIPVLNIVEMGMITHVQIGDENISITMTPTFVGCPAIQYIKKQICEAVQPLSDLPVKVIVDLETPWNSDRMTAESKEKLEKFGIAPPPFLEEELTAEMLDKVRCPHCKSTDTTLRSSFGSTLCRAIRFCFSCKQGFEQFKPVA